MFDFRVLPELLLEATTRFPGERALNYPDSNGGWITYSSADFRKRVSDLALGLRKLGIKKGETVGLIAPPSPEWLALDLAIQAAGGVTVPIFKRISPESFTHEVKDSGMRYLFVGNPEEIPMAQEIGARHARLITFAYEGTHPDFEKLLASGDALGKKEPDLFTEMCHTPLPDDLATIIYTSGSTGLPKGVKLSQRNLVSQIVASARSFPNDAASDSCLSVLPLAHIFERMVVYFYIASGLPVYFADSPKKLADFVNRVHPTTMTVVPRILEKIHLRMRENAEEQSGLKRVLAEKAIARAEVRDPDSRRRTALDLLFDALVYGKMRDALGGSFTTVICGSAKLDPEIVRFFINIGVPVYEGYGLTEASPVIAANTPENRKVGTVGMPFPGVEVKISEEGEILARSEGVMHGYLNRPDASKDAIDSQGWLHTGDLGSLDEDGFLRITGRKKDIFKKSTGEYVPPVPIERALEEFPVVDTAIIFADNRTYVTALLFPDMERLSRYKKSQGFESMSDKAFLSSDWLREKIQEHVTEVNRHRHHCEHVERFEIIDHEATVESGELTPTLKIRRHQIEEMYHDVIEGMYESIGGWK